MDLQMTQVLDNENTNDDTDGDIQVGVLRVGTTEHPIERGFTKIGRSPAVCKIVLADPSVSKVHAEIQAGCETAFISDQRSSNGTKIKDVSLKPFFYYTINDGDAIFLGTVKAIFKTNKSSVNNAPILPETPVASRRLSGNNTPGLNNASDFLFENSSLYQGDDSVIPGTQTKERKAPIFQEPLVPVDRRKGLNKSSPTVSPSAPENPKKSQNAATDLHDVETQQFASFVPSSSKKFEKASRSRDDLDADDLHEMETQECNDSSLSRQSRAPKKSLSDKIEKNIDDANIYEAKTQRLETENEVPKKENASKSRIKNTADSSRGCNSSGNFSRELQLSSSPSPPESPVPMDHSCDINQSQNLLELCETPLLAHLERAGGSETTNKDEVFVPETNITMEETINRKECDAANHVIAESDESLTDDDIDIDIVKATKSAAPSMAIEDDSATDDEGQFESFASRSGPKKKQTAEDRKDEANLYDAETQKMDEKSANVAGAKKRWEIPKNRVAEGTIYDAETQKMDREIPDVFGTKKRRDSPKNREAEGNVFDAETQKMDREIHDFFGTKKRRDSPKNREAEGNVFDAETQKMDQEIPDVFGTKKRRDSPKNREAHENFFDAETQKMDQEIHDVFGTKKRRDSPKNREAEGNVFDAETQKMDLEIPDVFGMKKRRDSPKSREAEGNLFDAETQRVDDKFVSVAGTKKLKKTSKNCIAEENVFDAETQKMDVEIPGFSGANKRRETLENRVDEANIFEAATQRMDDELPDVASPDKRRNLGKEVQNDTDIDLLPTQVLDVPTSTPMSRHRKFNLKMTKKSPRLSNDEDLYLAPTQIVSDVDVDGKISREVSIEASPSLGNEVVGLKKYNSHAQNMKKSKKSPKSVTEAKLHLAATPIMDDEDDTPVGSPRKRSAGGKSSSRDGSKGQERNNRPANLDETLMRNLGEILHEDADDQGFADESTQLMTQNLVDILRPTQSFEESKSDINDEIVDDSSEPRGAKRKRNSSPGTLGFTDGQAVPGSRWSKNLPAAASTMRDDGDEEGGGTKAVDEEPKLKEWLDPDSILFGLPEVKISGTYSNPGSPSLSTTSSHSDFVAPSLRESVKSAKTKESVAASTKEIPRSLKTSKAAESLEQDSPVVSKKSRLARRKAPRKIIDEEDQDSDEAFGYQDLKKIADRLLASDTVDTKPLKKDDDAAADVRETLSSTGRPMRRVRKPVPPKKDAVSNRRNRELPRAPSSLTVSGAKSKRSADESADAVSSSVAATRSSPRVPKSKKPTISRPKVAAKQGKESQEVEAILSATPKENIPIVSREPYAVVQVTKLEDSHVSCTSNADETPKANRKRRATMSVKDLSPSPATTKSRRTISEGVASREVHNEQHKILMTGLKDDYSKIVKKLGGTVVSEPAKATVLITDKVRRTYKFLCAVAMGLRVVSINWLLESKKAARFLDCDDFILTDPAAEKQYKFKLEKSLQTARTKKFLDGYTIVVTPKVNQPEVHELKAMIESSGGKLLTRAPAARAWNGKTVIVSREEDLTTINALLSKCPKSVKITVQSTEFILSGILRQEVNLVEHKLNIP